MNFIDTLSSVGFVKEILQHNVTGTEDFLALFYCELGSNSTKFPESDNTLNRLQYAQCKISFFFSFLLFPIH